MRGLLFPVFLRAALTLALILASSLPASAVVLDRIVALINNESITWLELYDSMERELAPRLKGLSDDERRDVLASSEESFLDSMIVKRLQLQEAVKQGIYVSDEEVEFTIQSIRTKYGLGPEEFKKAVEESGSEWSVYRDNLKGQIIIQKLVDKVVKSGMDEVSGENTGGDTKLRLRQIFFKLGGSQEDLTGKITEVYNALESGEEFETLARRVSEGPNAANGGDLGTLDESSLSESMRQALQGISSGQVAPPVTSGMGVHILKLLSRTSGAGTDRDSLFQQAYEKWLKGLREKARIEIRL